MSDTYTVHLCIFYVTLGFVNAFLPLICVLLLTRCYGPQPQGVTGAVLDYDEVEPVTFSIQGITSCKDCSPSDLSENTTLEVDITHADDPARTIAFETFSSKGQFTFSNLTAQKNNPLDIWLAVYENTPELFESKKILEGHTTLTPTRDHQVFDLTIELSKSH